MRKWKFFPLPHDLVFISPSLFLVLFLSGFVQPDSDLVVEELEGLGKKFANEKHIYDGDRIKQRDIQQAAKQIWKAGFECKRKRGKAPFINFVMLDGK